MTQLDIETFTLGDFQTNCFVVSYEDHEDCWIVDAGFDPQPLIDCVRQRDLNPVMIVLTHAHIDHVAGLEAVHQAWPRTPILIHEDEAGYPAEPMLNLSVMLGAPVAAPAPTQLIKHGDTLDLAGHVFEVRHTPGHSPGGICLYQSEAGTAIVGDTLFAGSIGRYDFPGSDGRLLMQSIRAQLMTLPDETTIHPGHGPSSTIGRERANNPFLLDPPADMR